MTSEYFFDRVMIVDDNETDNFICKTTMELEMFSKVIIEQTTVQGALLFLLTNQTNAQNWPQLIILDINLPIFDGFTFLYEFDRLPEKLRNNCDIIILSSSDNYKDKDRIAKHHFVKSYFTKPITADIIAEIKQNYLNKKLN